VSVLEIRNLRASVAGKEILTGMNLTVRSGEVHAIMGPNGAGKSTFSAVLMGKRGYEVTSGSVELDGVDLLAMPTWQRAVAGLHLVMQYPTEVPGVHVDELIEQAWRTRGRSTTELADAVVAEAERINFDARLVQRAVNVDLSGDELDSGLDVDALRDCARRVEDATNEDSLGAIVVTHYARLLEDLKPDFVHILVKGRIVESGGPELADRLEADGYAAFSG